MLDDLDALVWSKHLDAYGPATEMPTLIRGLLAKHPEVRERPWNG